MRPGTSWRQNVCFHIYAPAHKSDGGDHFRVDGSDMTITVYLTCAQEFANAGAEIDDRAIPNTEDTLPEPRQQRLFGEKKYCQPKLRVSGSSRALTLLTGFFLPEFGQPKLQTSP